MRGMNRAFLLSCFAVAACGGGGSTPAADAGSPDAAAAADLLDKTFGDQGTVKIGNFICEGIAVAPDDSILVAERGPEGGVLVIRIGTDGKPDASFGEGGGKGFVGGPGDNPRFSVTSDAIFVATRIGAGPGPPAAVVRLSANGVRDPGFGSSGVATIPGLNFIFGVGHRSDGGLDLVAVGASGGHAYTFARLSAAGVVDSQFGQPSPDTGDVQPGYFPHAVSIGEGKFVLSGASFTATNDAGGAGPVHAHLFVATDGVLGKAVDYDQAESQVLDLQLHGDRVYVMRNLFRGGKGEIERRAFDLTADSSFAGATVPKEVNAVYGPYNGGALAVSADGALTAVGDADSRFIDQFRSDGVLTVASTSMQAGVPGNTAFCGLAYDSHGRAVLGFADRVVRLQP